MQYPVIIENLCHAYKDFPVYDSLSVQFEQGRIYGILGKNGVGKTTLIKILMGFLKPVSGKCTVLGEPSHALSAQTRNKIALLFERHLAYEFFTIEQAEKYTSQFYPKWNKDIFYDLVNRLRLPHTHKIFHMSEGQRSQVVLGLLLAQQAELFILDDYSMGLDAGYRSLFIDYLQEYLKENNATVILTSHVVQNMEHFVDDILLLEKGGKTAQYALPEFMRTFHCYAVNHRYQSFQDAANAVQKILERREIKNIEIHGNYFEIYSFLPKEAVCSLAGDLSLDMASFKEISMSLEDAFIGYTGRY